MIWGGSPAKIIKAAEDGRIVILVSAEIVKEISRTLAYPRLRRIYEGAGVSRQELMETVLRIGKFVEVAKSVNIIREDPADNKFLECALAGEADYLVSGDKHVLKIGAYKRTEILVVNVFLRLLESNH
jgi:hypothetical protein